LRYINDLNVTTGEVYTVTVNSQVAGDTTLALNSNIYVQANMGTTNGVGGGGNAKAGYADKVRKKILPLIIFNPSLVAGNPSTEVAVELAPDGTIISRKVLKSSGDAGWDRAVLKAIDDAETLPKDDDGKVPKQVRLNFKPKD
jgi:TolA protein